MNRGSECGERGAEEAGMDGHSTSPLREDGHHGDEAKAPGLNEGRMQQGAADAGDHATAAPQASKESRDASQRPPEACHQAALGEGLPTGDTSSTPDWEALCLKIATTPEIARRRTELIVKLDGCLPVPPSRRCSPPEMALLPSASDLDPTPLASLPLNHHLCRPLQDRKGLFRTVGPHRGLRKQCLRVRYDRQRRRPDHQRGDGAELCPL